MKTFKNLILAFVLLFSFSTFAQNPQLTWEFKNVSIISPGGGALDSLRFEVWVSADIPGSYFGLSIVAIDYPDSVFGSNITDPNVNNLRFERGIFLQQNLGGVYYYDIFPFANFSPQIFATMVQLAFSFPPFPVPSGILEVPTTPSQFMVFTAAIQDTCGEGYMSFNEDLMNGAQECAPDCSFADPNIYVQDEMISFPLESCTVGTNENAFKEIQIWSAANNIYINAPEITKGEIVVINMMGQEVKRKQIEQGINVLKLNNTDAYYIVKVIGMNTVKTGKVFIR
jgi:hypothetical protein